MQLRLVDLKHAYVKKYSTILNFWGRCNWRKLLRVPSHLCVCIVLVRSIQFIKFHTISQNNNTLEEVLIYNDIRYEDKKKSFEL